MRYARRAPISSRLRSLPRWPSGQVAERLGIDIRTVKFHASNIYWKLGARHRSEAVAIACRLGLAG